MHGICFILTCVVALAARGCLAKHEEGAVVLEGEGGGLCSVTGFSCVGRDVYRQCSGGPMNRFFTCEQGFVCSASEPSGRMCIAAPPSCQTEGAFVVPGACSHYYLCMRSGSNIEQFVGYCEPGFEFSTRLGRCAVPSEAGCSQPEPTTTTTESTTTMGSTTTEVTSSSTDATPPSSTPARSAFSCPSQGQHSDPASCRHFYQCVRAGTQLRALRILCPRFLPHFSPQRRSCWYLDDQCTTACTAF